MPLNLKIVTPDKLTFSEEVDSVVLPGVEGELGIYPMHIPLMTSIHPGELVISQRGKVTHLAVGEGFVEVTADSVSVLTDMAVEEAAINEAKVQEALDRAQTRLKEGALEGEDLAAVESAIARSFAQLKVKRRTHS
ncbi:MAG TPA: ATP synthase F1 subunit epsilon [Chthoniobacterales bacterium]|jgi:F-type H+-transporting ATPase subunit epsilon